MLDDSGLPTRLITLGVVLVALGLGCHFWSDRVYRTAGLAISMAQLGRYRLNRRIEAGGPAKTSENRTKWLEFCDRVTAVLLVMAFMHAIATIST